jgi:hypothetical protein
LLEVQNERRRGLIGLPALMAWGRSAAPRHRAAPQVRLELPPEDLQFVGVRFAGEEPVLRVNGQQVTPGSRVLAKRPRRHDQPHQCFDVPAGLAKMNGEPIEQTGVAPIRVQSVARKTLVGQDGPNVPIELDRFVRREIRAGDNSDRDDADPSDVNSSSARIERVFIGRLASLETYAPRSSACYPPDRVSSKSHCGGSA